MTVKKTKLPEEQEPFFAGYETDKSGELVKQFLAPPFSLFDARSGYWQSRKRDWMSLGMESELGRGVGMLFSDPTAYYINFYTEKTAYEKKHGKISTADFANYLGLDTLRNTQKAVDKLSPGGSPDPLARARMGKQSIMKIKGKKVAECMGKFGGEYGRKTMSGTSIFDPVLCELLYRWFCPTGGRILDPFAGGSVRGIVAAYLGYKYVGIDLSENQVVANRVQAERIVRNKNLVTNYDDITPVEKHGNMWIKRDDLFSFAGIRGGKVRTCWVLAQGAKGLITAGSRMSPQVNIVAHIAKELGIPSRVHIPEGELSPELLSAKKVGAEIIQHKPGYNNVIIKRAEDDADVMVSKDWVLIPFGMECKEAVRQTAKQVVNIPKKATRLVVPVGSGMTLAGILHGLEKQKRKIPVLGVCVGADPEKRLDKFAPAFWREMVKLVHVDTDYHKPLKDKKIDNVILDEIYEAKCLDYLQDGDCMWIVGIRETQEVSIMPQWVVGDGLDVKELTEGMYDFVFSCPPYYNLEIYSEDKRDLSNFSTYEDFLYDYCRIIKRSVSLLKENRFACFVVSEIRDSKGFYRGFVPDTIFAFENAGAKFYNEGILLTIGGSLPIRIPRQFRAGRKLGRTHQNVLIFYKGDVSKIREALGNLEE